MTRKYCNICGRQMDEVDEAEELSIHTCLGYGTKYDGCLLELDICCRCMENLIEECEINPISERGCVSW